MPATDLKGIIAASITPFTADFRIDVPRLSAHVGRLLAEGCSFVSTFGTTGEGSSLAVAEKLEALARLKASGADMGRQVPAVMTPVLSDAAAMLEGIGALGCRAALILPPFYYGGDETGIAAWFDALIARTPAAKIDLLLYNIPRLSRIRFTQSLVGMILARHGSRIVGIKDSTGEVDNGVMLARTFPQLAVFTGDDRVLPHLLAAGGAGMIGGLPNLFARDLAALHANPSDARLLDRQRQRILAVDGNGGLVALKAGLAAVLRDEDYARAMPPMTALSAEARRKLMAEFADSGFHADA